MGLVPLSTPQSLLWQPSVMSLSWTAVWFYCRVTWTFKGQIFGHSCFMPVIHLNSYGRHIWGVKQNCCLYLSDMKHVKRLAHVSSCLSGLRYMVYAYEYFDLEHVKVIWGSFSVLFSKLDHMTRKSYPRAKLTNLTYACYVHGYLWPWKCQGHLDRWIIFFFTDMWILKLLPENIAHIVQWHEDEGCPTSLWLSSWTAKKT